MLEAAKDGSPASSAWRSAGTVAARLPGKANDATRNRRHRGQGDRSPAVLNRCPTPPFEVYSVPQESGSLGDHELANEDLRLQYRYLDLRRPVGAEAVDPAATTWCE